MGLLITSRPFFYLYEELKQLRHDVLYIGYRR